MGATRSALRVMIAAGLALRSLKRDKTPRPTSS
jgi:hypothetical protein